MAPSIERKKLKEIKKMIGQYQAMNKKLPYEETVPYIQEMEQFLLRELEKEPSNLEFICTLASVQYELRYEEEDCIQLLEDFLKEYGPKLKNQAKARLLTNLGFYYRESDEPAKEEIILKQAEEYGSPYVETYYGLGTYYFAEWEDKKWQLGKNLTYRDIRYLIENAEYYFKKAMEIVSEYQMVYSYGVALYMNEKYSEAKEIFENLLKEYPCRDRIKISIVRCEIALGNKAKALKLLSEIQYQKSENEEEADHLSKVKVAYEEFYNEPVDGWEMADHYYNLGEYEKHADFYRQNLNNWAIDEKSPDFYYSLFILGKNQELDDFVGQFIQEQEEEILEFKNEEINEDYSLEEQQEDIEYHQTKILKMKEVIDQIKNHHFKPEVPIHMFPIYGCYMVDCIRHQKLTEMV